MCRETTQRWNILQSDSDTKYRYLKLVTSNWDEGDHQKFRHNGFDILFCVNIKKRNNILRN